MFYFCRRNKKHMKFKHYTLFALLFTAAVALAQTPKTGKAGIWLNANDGINLANCYDNGTIPYSYLGAGANLSLGGTVEWRRCYIQLENRLFFNAFLKLNGFSGTADHRLEFLYRLHDDPSNSFHLWVGGDIQTYMDIKENTDLMNASMGLTLFENLCLTSMVRYDFASIRGGTHKLLSAHGKLVLPLAGIAVRPGFAYIDNYTGSLNSIENLLSNYEAFPKMFSGICTDIGLTFNLLNGNRIGMSYRWDYLSTGHKGSSRFDNAIHSINLNFWFKLN